VGKSVDVRIPPGREPVVVAMLRSGLFVAEGIREALYASALVLAEPSTDLTTANLSERVVIVVDAVINTGSSIRPLLSHLRQQSSGKLLVAALVGYRPTVESLVEEYPDIDFALGRVSERSYVGRGGTDTGSRLFGF
jgi:uracil phosphoribosyltransferase